MRQNFKKTIPPLLVLALVVAGGCRAKTEGNDLAQALTSENIRDVDKAIRTYTKKIAENPEDAVAFNNRGGAYLRKNMLPEAVADFSRAVNIDAEFAEAYHNRALAYKQLGQFDRAVYDFTQAARINPDDPTAPFNLSLIHI